MCQLVSEPRVFDSMADERVAIPNLTSFEDVSRELVAIDEHLYETTRNSVDEP